MAKPRARAVPRSSPPIALALTLAALTLLVFAQVHDFSFVNWDDPTYITANPHIGEGLTWHSVWWALTTGYPPYWHPLTWLSHLADVQFFGLDAGWHHLTNLAIHTASVVVLFVVLRRLTGAVWPSAFVAAVFGVHPLHVESVAWVAERKDVLSTLGVWITIAAYARYVRQPSPRAYAFVLMSFALALMAKPMVVTLPVVLLLIDAWPLSRAGFDLASLPTWRRLVLEKLPLVALAAAASVATLLVQQHVGAVAGLGQLPAWVRMANALVACVRYLGHAVWPADLAAFYPYPRGFPAPIVLGAAALLGAITAAAFAVRRSHRYVIVGWLWFLVTVSPVLGFLQAGEQAMADRFMYMPLVGLTIVVAWGTRDLVGASGGARTILAAAGTVVVMASAWAAAIQTATWRDSVTLWTHALSVTSGNYLAEENLAQALRDRGDLDAALAHYTRAIAEAPPGADKYYAVVQNDLGLVLLRQGRADEALAHFTESVRLDPSFAQGQTNLGNALAAIGRSADAVPHYEAAVRLDPTGVEARVGLGGVLLREGRAADAQTEFASVLQAQPSLAEAHNGLGSALALQNQTDAAMAEYAEALRLKPDLATAHVNLAVQLLKRDRRDDARRHLEAALAADPGYTAARQLLDTLK